MQRLLDIIRRDQNLSRGFTRLGVDDMPELPEPIPVSRRRILTGALSAFGLVSLVAIADYLRKGPGQAEIVYHPDERVYTDKDEIKTPLGRIRIDGWKVAVDSTDVSATLNHGLEFRLVAKCSNGDSHGYISGIPKKGNDREIIELKDFVERPKMPMTGWPGTNNYYYFNTLPHPNGNGRITLELALFDPRAGENGRIDIFNYNFNPNIYYYPFEENSDKLRVISEKNVGKSLLAKVHDIHRLFSGYEDDLSVILAIDENAQKIDFRRTPSTEFGEFTANRFILMTTDNFTLPFFPRQPEMYATHEIAHNIFHSSNISKYIGKRDLELEAKAALENSFKALIDYSGGDPSSPLFRIFTENRHLGVSDQGMPSIMGYPSRTPSELFASTVTVLRYLKSGFLKDYGELVAYQRALVKQVCANTIKILTEINPSRDLLKRAFPDIDLISRRIGLTYN